MKKWYIISGIIGALFFCVAYVVVEMQLIYSLIIALLAYIASVLVFRKKMDINLKIGINTNNLQEITDYGVEYINKIHGIGLRVENKELIKNIEEICDTFRKIIARVNENPKQLKYIKKFIGYYFPFTVKILNQYDKVEDEKLNSEESKAFMLRVEKLIEKINIACKEQLNNMYEGDLVDVNADIKVFESMLKTDGLVDQEMNIKMEKEA